MHKKCNSSISFNFFLPKPSWSDAMEPARCFAPNKSWICGQLAHCFILQGGGEMCMLCFLTLGASRHDKLSCKNKLCPNTSKRLTIMRTLTQDPGYVGHTRSYQAAYIHSPPEAINIGAVDDMIDTLWCDWWNFKTLLFDIINKTSHLVHETCLLTPFDLIDEPTPGMLHCCPVVHFYYQSQ